MGWWFSFRCADYALCRMCLVLTAEISRMARSKVGSIWPEGVRRLSRSCSIVCVLLEMWKSNCASVLPLSGFHSFAIASSREVSLTKFTESFLVLNETTKDRVYCIYCGSEPLPAFKVFC